MPRNNVHQTGSTLLELALALSLVAIVSLPLMRMNAGQKAHQQLLAQKAEKQFILEQIEGFVLSHKRLPCPASHNNGLEALAAPACQQRVGWLPTQSLGMAPQKNDWQMAVATLEQVGAPAAGAFFADPPLATLTLQQLSEIVFSPPTPSVGIQDTALPALHICIHHAQQNTPTPQERGCGTHTLQTASAVLVIFKANTQTGPHQFFIQPNAPEQNPAWLSYERLVWLWMKTGVLNQTTTE